MSMTQQIVDELRELADDLSLQSARVSQSGEWSMACRLQSFANRARKCADDLGDD